MTRPLNLQEWNFHVVNRIYFSEKERIGAERLPRDRNKEGTDTCEHCKTATSWSSETSHECTPKTDMSSVILQSVIAQCLLILLRILYFIRQDLEWYHFNNTSQIIKKKKTTNEINRKIRFNTSKGPFII